MHGNSIEHIAAMTAWDIVPEEKAGSSRSQGLTCSKYGIHNGTGMYTCRFYQTFNDTTLRCSKYIVILCSKYTKNQ